MVQPLSPHHARAPHPPRGVASARHGLRRRFDRRDHAQPAQPGALQQQGSGVVEHRGHRSSERARERGHAGHGGSPRGHARHVEPALQHGLQLSARLPHHPQHVDLGKQPVRMAQASGLGVHPQPRRHVGRSDVSRPQCVGHAAAPDRRFLRDLGAQARRNCRGRARGLRLVAPPGVPAFRPVPALGRIRRRKLHHERRTKYFGSQLALLQPEHGDLRGPGRFELRRRRCKRGVRLSLAHRRRHFRGHAIISALLAHSAGHGGQRVRAQSASPSCPTSPFPIATLLPRPISAPRSARRRST